MYHGRPKFQTWTPFFLPQGQFDTNKQQFLFSFGFVSLKLEVEMQNDGASKLFGDALEVWKISWMLWGQTGVKAANLLDAAHGSL